MVRSSCALLDALEWLLLAVSCHPMVFTTNTSSSVFCIPSLQYASMFCKTLNI